MTAEERQHQALQRQKRRRLFTLVGLGLFIIAFIVGAILVVKYSLNKIEQHSAPVDPAAAFEPVECSADMMDAELVRSGGVSGQPVQFTLNLTNDGDRPCYIETGYETVWLEITSGDQTVYNSKVCGAGPAQELLLLDKGLSVAEGFWWNGLNRGADCSGTSTALPGTYIARVMLDGQEIGDRGHVFELTQSVAPAPAPGPTEDAEGGDGVTDGEDVNQDGVQESETGEDPAPDQVTGEGTDSGNPQ